MRLYVNVDHVATIRQARRTTEPDPVDAARASLAGGADGITVHLREDRRHINDDDVRRLAAEPFILNLELATAPDIIELAAELKPHQATFVPERREEITTEGGLDLASHGAGPDPRLTEAITRLHRLGIRVSLFIDPDPAAVAAAARLGVDAVELHTGSYSAGYRDDASPLERLRSVAVQASAAGLAVHAGHGLTLDNVGPVAAIEEIEELNIGHHLVSLSVISGIERAVQRMRAAIDDAPV